MCSFREAKVVIDLSMYLYIYRLVVCFRHGAERLEFLAKRACALSSCAPTCAALIDLRHICEKARVPRERAFWERRTISSGSERERGGQREREHERSGSGILIRESLREPVGGIPFASRIVTTRSPARRTDRRRQPLRLKSRQRWLRVSLVI